MSERGMEANSNIQASVESEGCQQKPLATVNPPYDELTVVDVNLQLCGLPAQAEVQVVFDRSELGGGAYHESFLVHNGDNLVQVPLGIYNVTAGTYKQGEWVWVAENPGTVEITESGQSLEIDYNKYEIIKRIPAEAKPAAKPSSFKVVGYLPDYRDYFIDNIQYDKLTHLLFFSLQAELVDGQPTGNLQPLSGDALDALTQIVPKAHENNVQVGICLGGWVRDKGFSEIAASPTLCETFVQNVMDFVNEYDLDGVDIDWEYPIYEEKENYRAFMQAFAGQLHSQEQFLSVAGAAFGNNAQVNAECADLVDFVNIMSYAQPDHGTMEQAKAAMDYWLKYIPPEKAILGVPFYGLDRCNSAELYHDLLVKGADPYADDYRGYHYNGITTMQEKTRYAQQRGGGIMIWEIGQDAIEEYVEYSLLNTIAEVINNEEHIKVKRNKV